MKTKATYKTKKYKRTTADTPLFPLNQVYSVGSNSFAEAQQDFEMNAGKPKTPTQSQR